jgi:MoaA/NifB/PqqE/SkfB family radical SAM enzyme
MTVPEVLAAWWNILTGRAPMLSIEITRECPLSCPGCYAYGDTHLGDGATLRELSDFRGDALVERVLNLVRKHQPLHVSLVGGEPLVRHRELSRILPVLSEWGVNTLVVTSAVIPIPEEWVKLQRSRVAVSVDGLPEHHDIRRKPATYERILRNIEGRQVNVHWTITRPMLQREGYLEEYVAFWSARPEVNRIWVSLYTPQIGEQSAEMLKREDRESITRQLTGMQSRYPKLLMREGIARELLRPPSEPAKCLFSKMSVNYSADFKTRVEPCIFGGTPDCANCGCATTTGLEYLGNVKLPGGFKLRHLVNTSIGIGTQVGRLRKRAAVPHRWGGLSAPESTQELVQISSR